MRTLITLLALLVLPPGSRSQPDRRAEQRRATLETVLRIKDLRTPHDGELLRLLGDPDPVVRLEATLAFGSIQDTAAIAPLTRNLTDPILAVQQAAAFALGQTGRVLSPDGRRALAADLIWKRIPTTLAVERLIGEIGKFALEDALDDLLIRLGNLNEGPVRRGLTTAIGRFAEREIVTDDAVRYLLRSIRPAEQTPREVVYALRRVGDHPRTRAEIEELSLLWRHPDAGVRMQVATLLGMLDTAPVTASPLMSLARHDRDWRVRVNAVRSLGTQRGADGVRSLLAELLFDRNLHVAITAAGALAGSLTDTTAETDEALRQLASIAANRSDNFAWQLQAEAAAALARIKGPAAFPTLSRARASHPGVRQGLLLAVARTGSDSAAGVLRHALDDDPPVRAAALEGLLELVRRRPADSALADLALASAIGALASDDPGVLGTAAMALRAPELRRPSAVPALIRSARAVSVPSETEVLLEMIETMGAIGDSRAVPFLVDLLNSPEGVVRQASARALGAITGRDYTDALPRREGALVTDHDFATLRALPDTVMVRIETIEGTIQLELYTRIAPFTVMNLLKLQRQRAFYNGVPFHRVVPNFVIQGGDPRGDGWGGPGWTIRSEFSPVSFERGTVGMASAGTDTEGSQFFITHSWQPHLDGRFTLFGRVISGQDVVDRIQEGDRIQTIGVPEGIPR